MKDSKLQLREGYYSTINNISVNSTTIPLFDRVPRGQAEPYIYFERLIGNEQSTKTSEGNDVTVTLTIVTRDTADAGGRKFSEQIADKVIQEITTNSPNLLSLSSDKYLIWTRIANSDSFEEETENGVRYFYQIEFQHRIGY